MPTTRGNEKVERAALLVTVLFGTLYITLAK